jgi:hypothetical protein
MMGALRLPGTILFSLRRALSEALPVEGCSFIGVHRLLFSVVCNGQHGLQLLFRFVPFVG